MARPVSLPKGSRFITLASVCIVVAAIYFAQEVLIPLALAILLCFLLAPLVRRLERLKLPRVAAVMTVVAAAFVVILALGYVIFRQVQVLGNDLPRYHDNIIAKARALRLPGGGITEEIKKVGTEIEKAANQPASHPATTTTAPATSTAPAVNLHGIGRSVSEEYTDPDSGFAR